MALYRLRLQSAAALLVADALLAVETQIARREAIHAQVGHRLKERH